MLTIIQYYGTINISATLVWFINIFKRLQRVMNILTLLSWDDDISTAILRETGEIFLLLYLTVSLLFEAIIEL